MSDSSVKGKAFEIKVQKITTKILHIETKRDSRSGAGLHKQDVRDRYNLLPLFIECKDQESLSVKKEWRIADQKSSYGQAPVVVFPDDSEVLCVMRYSDLLQFIKEAADYKEEAEDLRQPVVMHHIKNPSPKTQAALVDLGKAVQKKMTEEKTHMCRNGHIADQFGYCMQLDCKYSRGYRPPKVKK